MNSFGRKFRISIFGESHGELIGVTLDGVPPGLSLSEQEFIPDLERRRSGALGTTPRQEEDRPHIISGVFRGHTTGAPLTIVFANRNTQSGDYDNLTNHPRPGHADFAAGRKYRGYNDPRGGGHFSGRLTLGLVAAGVVAKKILSGVFVEAKIIEIGGSQDFEEAIRDAITHQDSVGGVIECTATGIPVGWGEPFFDSIESRLSHALFSIPAVKGVEFGSGFEAAGMFGSLHNDPIIAADGTTPSNNAGGINGGISNGNPLLFRVAVKPTSSIGQPQQTYNFDTGQIEELQIVGRHDVCIALRVPVVVEAVTAIVLADFSQLA